MSGLLGGGPHRFEWPVTLTEDRAAARGLTAGIDVVRLRPMRRGDESAWQRLRLADDARLTPWEATLPAGSGERLDAFSRYVRRQNQQARRGASLPFALEADGALAGQVTAAPIEWGSLRSASVGYWLGSAWEGRGLMTLAVAMVLDHLLGPAVGLHRVEVNVRPANARSLGVCRRLGLREEGVRRAYMHINGAWADHVSFAVVAPEVPASGFVGHLSRV